MQPAFRLAALAVVLAAAGPPQTAPPAATDAVEELRTLRKELTQDELTQQRLLKQKHTADVRAREAEDQDATLRLELKDARTKLDVANGRVVSLTKEVAKEQTLAGDLAAKDGVAEVDAADEENDDRSETRAAKSVALLLRRATTAQTSLLAQDQRLQVESLEGMRAKMAASSWSKQASVAASALESSLGSAAEIQGALDEVLEREHRAEEARRKEKAFLTSRLKSEMEKLKAAQNEVRVLKAQRDHRSDARNGTHSHDAPKGPEESTSELHADLRADIKQLAALNARLKGEDKEVQTLEKDNEKAAGKIRDLKQELHAERQQRGEQKAPKNAPKVSHIEHAWVRGPGKRTQLRTKEQEEEEEDIY